MKAAQSALRKAKKEIVTIKGQSIALNKWGESLDKDLSVSRQANSKAEANASSAAHVAIMYRNQRDELDRQLFLAERMIGSITCQVSSKVRNITIAARPEIEDEPNTWKFLNRIVNGGQDEECQQGAPLDITVNACSPVRAKKVDES